MLPTDSVGDPIVAILCLAYKRGCALRREQEKLTEKTVSAGRDENPVKWKDSNALSIMGEKNPDARVGDVP